MLRVLYVGTQERDEFEAAITWLQANARVTWAADVSAGKRHLEENFASPQLIVLAMPRPGVFSEADVAVLRTAAPLARIVSLAGSWCEGQAHRNGAALPGVQRIAWHEFAARLAGESRRVEVRRSPGWALPLTSGVDELADFSAGQPLPQGTGLVVIDAADEDSAAALGDALSLAGYASVWLGLQGNAQVRGAALAVLCGAGWDEKTAIRLQNLREKQPQAPVVVLLDFPRQHDYAAALAAGAFTVLAKPFTIGEFLGQLGEARRSSAPQWDSVRVA